MTEFKHIQTAHCENGVTTSLLHFHGAPQITEPLAFGMGAGIFYIHIPFMQVNNGPAISFRNMPGTIFNKTCKSLGISIKRKKFKSPVEAEDFLNKKLEEGVPVGCQVGVFHLAYFPKEYRFHFNAHNLIVYGKEENRYLISDPVMETVTTLSPEELSKVRFAKGQLAPKGHIYFPENAGEISPELLKKGVINGINKSIKYMLYIPGNFAGVKGIKYTANKIRSWKKKLGDKKAALYLGQIVRMQEEIGTGGGGFRYIYAAFLEEAAEILERPELLTISAEMTQSGDLWRDTAVKMASIYKGRSTEQKDFDAVADALIKISEIEKNVFVQLKNLRLKP